MKNKDKPKQKEKEFSASPFKGLKGLALEQQPLKSSTPAPPQPKADSREGDDESLFLSALGEVRPLKGAGHKEQPRGKGAAQELEDQRLFLDAFADVRPLAPGQAAPHRTKAQAARAEKDEEEMRVFLQAVEALKIDVRFGEEQEAQPEPARPVNRLRQVRRGGIRIDFELDLHGLTKDEAVESLERFITGAYNRGQKGVLVITGKGYNSPGEPVLRQAVAFWLKETGKKMVTEFVAAPNDMGGTGAFVVFLREKPQPEPAPS